MRSQVGHLTHGYQPQRPKSSKFGFVSAPTGNPYMASGFSFGFRLNKPKKGTLQRDTPVCWRCAEVLKSHGGTPLQLKSAFRPNTSGRKCVGCLKVNSV